MVEKKVFWPKNDKSVVDVLRRIAANQSTAYQSKSALAKKLLELKATDYNLFKLELQTGADFATLKPEFVGVSWAGGASAEEFLQHNPILDIAIGSKVAASTSASFTVNEQLFDRLVRHQNLFDALQRGCSEASN